jgi:hypothetical protein
MRKPFRGFGSLVVLLLGIWLLSSAAPAQAGRWKDASERHERDCKSWCKEHGDCGKCLPLLPCPPGTRKLKSWKGYGKNWHACSRPGDTNSKKHERDCKKWCKEHEDCGKCNPLPCPPGTRKLKSWTGAGKNWYACSRPGDTNSKKHERDCKAWCKDHEDCGKCLPLLPCPPGTRKLKSWTGAGKNWYACSKPGDTNSKKHERDCKKWCKEHEDCGKCNPLPCPPPSKNLKKWTGPGKNWYACRKIVDPNKASRQRHQECKNWCGADKNCKKCLPALPCPPGTEKLKSFSGPGPGWYACGQKSSWRADSAAQRQKCLDWCQANRQCEKCVTSKTACPQGTHVYSSFEDSGQNYYACGRPAVITTPPSQPRESQRRPGTPEVRFGN